MSTMLTAEELRAQYDPQVKTIMGRLPDVMQNHQLPSWFKAIKLTATPAGMVLLLCVLDDKAIARLTKIPVSRYLTSDVLHSIATTVCDGQFPVLKVNHSGVGYGVVLKAPQLPTTVPFPGHRAGRLLWGVGQNSQLLWTAWAPHILLAGMTGSGKSTMLRCLVAQALLEGFQLALCDLGARTFAMLEGHPALIAPLATKAETAVEMVKAVQRELDRRDALYKQVAGYPDDLDQYNDRARAQGLEPLRRLVVVFDEYNELVRQTGGARGKLSTAVSGMVAGARKWGVTMVFAAQEFQRELSGWVRAQCDVRVCFRVKERTTALIAVESMVPLRLARKGRAVMEGKGVFQAYLFEKDELVALAVKTAGQASGLYLSPDDAKLVRAVGLDAFSRQRVAEVCAISTRQAEKILEEWDRAGRTTRRPEWGNARVLTEAVLQAAGVLADEAGNDAPPPGMTAV